MDHFRYVTPARLLHWIMALAIILTVPAGLIMVESDIPRALQDALFIYHKNVGVFLFILVLLRLVVRLRNPPPPRKIALPRWQERIARTTHGLLYALLFVLPVAGYIRVRAGGFPIESLDLMGVPWFVPQSDALASRAKALHAWAGYALIVVLFLHVGAALHHALVKRDGTLARMWPPMGRRRP